MSGSRTDFRLCRKIIEVRKLTTSRRALSLSTPVALPALCALAGCLTPPLGPTTRVVWSAVVGTQPDLLRRAYSLDAAADEVLFMVGPGVTGFAVALGGPAAGVLLTAALALVGTLAVAASPLVRAAPPAILGPTGGRHIAPLRASGFARLLVVMLGVGTALGGVELVAVELGGHGGSAGSATLVTAVALGGATGSVLYGCRTWRRALGQQLSLLCTALTCALTGALAATTSRALLPVVLCLCGLFIAPALVVAYRLADRLTDPRVHPEAGALITTANNLGASVGTAAAALVLDHVGVRVSLLVVAAAAAATAATAFPFRRNRRVRRTHQEHRGGDDRGSAPGHNSVPHGPHTDQTDGERGHRCARCSAHRSWSTLTVLREHTEDSEAQTELAASTIFLSGE